MDKLLTIVIPSYNSEKTLNKCVDSLIDERTIDCLDIIIVNDGSKDNTSAIAHSYADRFPNSIRVIDKENGGHGSGVNAGIQNATGKYFRVLDSDDWFDTEVFVEFIEALKKCDCDVVHTDGINVSAVDGSQVCNTLTGYEYERIYGIEEAAAHGFRMTMPGITLRTEIIREHSLKLQEKTYYVDNEFCILPLAYVRSFIFLNANIYRYLVAQGTQSMTVSNRVKHFGDLLKVVYRLCEEYAGIADDNPGKQLMKQHIYEVAMSVFPVALIYNTDRREGRAQYKEYMSKLKSVCPEIRKAVSKKGKVYFLMNIFGITTQTYIKIQEKRGRNVVC